MPNAVEEALELIDRVMASGRIEKLETERVKRVERSISAGDPLLNIQQALDQKTQEMNQDASIFKSATRRMFAEDVPPGKDRMVEELRFNATVALSTAGTILGARVPVAPGPLGFVINPLTGAFFGGGIGAVAGQLIPEEAMSFAESVGILPEGTREKFGRSETELKVMRRGEVALELLTGAAGQFPRLLARPMIMSATDASKASMELAEFGSKKLQVDLLPFQAGEQSSIAQAVLNVVGRFPIIGAPARGPVFLAFTRSISSQKVVRAQATKAAKTISSKIGDVSTFPDLSHAIMGDAQRLLKATLGKFGKEYDKIFSIAKRNGVRVIPRQLRRASKEVLEKIIERSAIGKLGNRILSPADKKLFDYISSPAVKGLSDVQTLKSYDGAISALDDFIAKVHVEKLPRRIISDLNDLRNAMLTDITKNLFGRNAKEIGLGLRSLDKGYTTFLSAIFETSTAKKFGRVRRKGLRGAVFDPTTQTSVDALAQHVLELNQPQAINELLNLMTLSTSRRLVATVVEKGLNSSLDAGAKQGTFIFDTAKARVYFGFSDKTSGRFQSMETLLKRTGSPFTMEDIRKTIDVFAHVRSFDVADASTFVQRRLILTGVAAGATFGILNNFTEAGPFAVGGLLILLVGSRGFSRAVSNPAGAKAWRAAIRAETTLGLKRAAAIRFLRIAMTPSTGEIDRAALTGDELALERGEAKSIFEKGKLLINELVETLLQSK